METHRETETQAERGTHNYNQADEPPLSQGDKMRGVALHWCRTSAQETLD